MDRGNPTPAASQNRAKNHHFSLASEWGRREQAWIDRTRARVAQLSQGRVGSVYLSDFGELGAEQFVRQYYPQPDNCYLREQLPRGQHDDGYALIVNLLQLSKPGKKSSAQSRIYTGSESVFTTLRFYGGGKKFVHKYALPPNALLRLLFYLFSYLATNTLPARPGAGRWVAPSQLALAPRTEAPRKFDYNQIGPADQGLF